MFSKLREPFGTAGLAVASSVQQTRPVVESGCGKGRKQALGNR